MMVFVAKKCVFGECSPSFSISNRWSWRSVKPRTFCKPDYFKFMSTEVNISDTWRPLAILDSLPSPYLQKRMNQYL